MILTRQNIIDQLISFQNNSDRIPVNLNEKVKSKIIESIKLKNQEKQILYSLLSDQQLIRQYRLKNIKIELELLKMNIHENHDIEIRIFAPGKFILTDSIQKFICQWI